MDSEVKVYEMNDCEWMAAASPLEAAIGYAENMSMSLDRVVQDDLIDIKDGCPRELSVKEMRRLKFHDEDDEGFGKPGYKPRSFREQLNKLITEGAKFPRYFASTEF
jgi:hypothetical protein